LNLKEKEIRVSSFRSKPDVFHWSTTNLVINIGLLLLFIKKGSDKFKVAFERDFDVLNIGIIK